MARVWGLEGIGHVVYDTAILPARHIILAIRQPMFSIKDDVGPARYEDSGSWEFSSGAYEFEGSDMDADPLVR